MRGACVEVRGSVLSSQYLFISPSLFYILSECIWAIFYNEITYKCVNENCNYIFTLCGMQMTLLLWGNHLKTCSSAYILGGGATFNCNTIFDRSFERLGYVVHLSHNHWYLIKLCHRWWYNKLFDLHRYNRLFCVECAVKNSF